MGTGSERACSLSLCLYLYMYLCLCMHSTCAGLAPSCCPPAPPKANPLGQCSQGLGLGLKFFRAEMAMGRGGSRSWVGHLKVSALG